MSVEICTTSIQPHCGTHKKDGNQPVKVLSQQFPRADFGNRPNLE